MLYLLTVYFEVNGVDEEVFSFETHNLDSVYQILGNNGHWFSDDRYNYIVYSRTGFTLNSMQDDSRYDVLFCK